MSKSLHISKDLSLPIGIANKTICIFGKGGSGKSNLEVVLAEELYAAGIPTCIVDPADVHFGIKSARDGKSAGLPFIIFGGLHADVPIYPENGKLLADLFLDRGLYMVIVTQPWTGGERSKFMTDFANQLYKRGPEKEQRGSARVLLLEEAHEYVPLSPEKGEQVMLGAMKRLYTVGRNYWIGFIAATRRPARMHTDLRNGADATAFFQIVGTQDRKAMTDYLGEMAEKDVREEIMSHVAKLPVGTAYFYQPHEEPALQRVHFRYRNTLDTTTTEITAGHKTVKPVLAEVDLSKLGEAMEAAREKAKADDPKELRKTINELRTQMRKLELAKPQAPVAEAKVKTETKVVEKKVVIEGTVTRLEKLAADLDTPIERIETLLERAHQERSHIKIALNEARELNAANLVQPPPKSLRARQTEDYRPTSSVQSLARQLDPKPSNAVVATNNGDFRLNKKQQEILNALAWFESIGITEPSNVQLGAVALIDTSGGYFSNMAGPLSSENLIARSPGKTKLTDKGRAYAQEPDSVPTLDDYHNMLRTRLKQLKTSTGKSIAMLNVLIENGRETVTTEQIGQAVGVDHTGGYFSNSIGPLSTLGLITRNRGTVEPTDILFPPGLS